MYRPLRLKKNEDRRIRAGHLWVFSNEVDTGATPLTDFSPGDPAMIQAHTGRPLGVAYVNPASLIAARLVSRDADARLNAALIADRLRAALALRERLYSEPFYRLCFGESDGLPGLVLDRYGDVVVGQATTAGMDVRADDVAQAVREVIAPAAMLWRNDTPVRRLEGLEESVSTAFGDVPDRLDLVEGSTRFQVSPEHGQKTGWFFDQRVNRDRLAHYVKGRRVLDLYSYAGAWGLRAAQAGADQVVCVDASDPALEQLVANAERNGLDDRVTPVCGDAVQALKAMADERFDVVILDPPAFIKRKRDIKAGTAAYRRVTELAMQVMTEDAILFACSCSYHLSEPMLGDVLRRSAKKTGRHLQLLEVLQQSPDHPVHPAIPETRYLKGSVARVRGG